MSQYAEKPTVLQGFIMGVPLGFILGLVFSSAMIIPQRVLNAKAEDAIEQSRAANNSLNDCLNSIVIQTHVGPVCPEESYHAKKASEWMAALATSLKHQSGY